MLGKAQKAILLAIYDSCKTRLDKTSSCLSLEEFIKCCGLSKNSIKTTLKRLEKANIIILHSFKQGPQGGRQYGIAEPINKEILLTARLDEIVHNSGTNSYTDRTQISTQPPPIVSSSINITTTTDPETIDCSPLADEGFGDSHIIQIRKEYALKPELALSDEIIQNSIDAMAFDLKHNDVRRTFKNSPAVVLVSMLKKGSPYCCKTPDKFLTPREEDLRKVKAMMESSQKRAAEDENKVKEYVFQEWLSALPEEELLDFVKDYTRLEGVPQKIYETNKKKKALASAKDYFDTMIWPQKLKQILAENK